MKTTSSGVGGFQEVLERKEAELPAAARDCRLRCSQGPPRRACSGDSAPIEIIRRDLAARTMVELRRTVS
jgi:hypothetical protein